MLLVLPKPKPALNIEADRKFFSLDEAGYKSLYFACPGAEGHGAPAEGLPGGGALAPPLAGSAESLCAPCKPRTVRTAL